MDCSAKDGSSSSVIPAPGGNPGFFSAELAWIPAFAGMTNGRSLLQLSAPLLSKGDTKNTRKTQSSDSFSKAFLPPVFVIFAPFVVSNTSQSFRLQLAIH